MGRNIVYKITNIKNKRYYIGSTQCEIKRMKTHFLLYEAAWKQNNSLHEDILKYGLKYFNIDILFRTDDVVEASRLESKLIRDNKDGKLIYNKTLGASGRRVFYQSDITFIRNLYKQKDLYIEEAYKKYYKDIVTFRAFKKVWHGETFKDISYDVYTKENKDWHFAKGQSRPGESNGRSILKLEDVREIRKRKSEGEKLDEVYESYKHLGIKRSGFANVWFNRTWTNVI